ncbi:GIY-YIG nuclease family protein [Dactylosporangium salmoneum]|uniref:Bacteriophage T5 Orf172 DNA-binding domain-containing protein n=1 Tax=Dactylosporangium salmoneum TaxID=53361 RepID=A0ABP5SXE4_9ACTN
MSVSDHPAQEREQWIDTVCTGLVGQAAEPTVLDPAGIVPELGEPDMIRALLVARVAALISAGRSTADVVRLLADSGVLTGPGAEPERLSGLVGTVRWRLASSGIGDSARLLGCGLRAWSPEGTYRLLLELWSARRLRSVSRSRVKRDLMQLWDVRDPAWLETCLSRSPRPLNGYVNIWTTLETEQDDLVRTCATIALRGDAESNQALDRWMDLFPGDATKAQHLLTMGTDREYVVQALRFLRRRKATPDPNLRKILEIFKEHREGVARAVEGLSTLERHLLRDRTDEERFQDGCLAELLWWSYAPMTRSWSVGSDVAHGMWGPLPWWRIRVRGDAQVQAAAATLTEGTRLLGLSRDPSSPNRLELICRRPRSGSPGLRAHFKYDLTSPANACELLLIGRRGDICIDLVEASETEDDTHLGTLRVTASDELAQMLTEIASKALAELSSPSDVDADGQAFSALGELLRQEATGAARRGPWSADREVLVTMPAGAAGEVMLETADPPTPLARPRQSGASSKSESGFGFVYVQRNPAMPDMLKIGFSRRLSEDRADELFRTSVPFPFQVSYRALTMHAREVEQAVHRLLDAQRVAPDREFFRVSQAMAEVAIRFCQERVTGIGSWEPMPVVHRLRGGDRVVLPLKAGQRFVVTAHPSPMATSAKVRDIWQAHSDGDLLELHITHDPGMIRGLSDGDEGAEEDPLPHLNRDCSAPNGHLIGRERLVAGDRLSWFSGHAHVVFEIHDFCQVVYRTWSPRFDPETGRPLSLNDAAPPVGHAAAAGVQEVLALDAPRIWAPRNFDPAHGWVQAATRESEPADWLPQLRRPN